MRILGIIQARMNSTRLPGKVMMKIQDKPLIGHLLDRVGESQLDGVIVAAPLNDAVSPLADYVQSRGVPFLAAEEENDVAGRFLAVLDSLPDYDGFVRMCADSPLLSPYWIDWTMDALQIGGQFVSNVGSATPPGQHVEGIQTELYRFVSTEFTLEDREHAGFPWFYRNLGEESCVVDTMDDFHRVERMICGLSS